MNAGAHKTVRQVWADRGTTRRGRRDRFSGCDPADRTSGRPRAIPAIDIAQRSPCAPPPGHARLSGFMQRTWHGSGGQCGLHTLDLLDWGLDWQVRRCNMSRACSEKGRSAGVIRERPQARRCVPERAPRARTSKSTDEGGFLPQPCTIVCGLHMLGRWREMKDAPMLPLSVLCALPYRFRRCRGSGLIGGLARLAQRVQLLRHERANSAARLLPKLGESAGVCRNRASSPQNRSSRADVGPRRAHVGEICSQAFDRIRASTPSKPRELHHHESKPRSGAFATLRDEVRNNINRAHRWGGRTHAPQGQLGAQRLLLEGKRRCA